jgi:hypothetical protein
MGFKRSWVQIPPARVQYPQMNTRIIFTAAAAGILLIPLCGDCADNASVRLNIEAFDFAHNLIVQGNFVADQKGEWSSHHPPHSVENSFIRGHGFAEYAKWHLAIDQRHSVNSKARYKFPFGDFQNVHRCGLLAVKARAHEYGYAEIETAAAQLLQMLKSTSPGRQKRVD